MLILSIYSHYPPWIAFNFTGKTHVPYMQKQLVSLTKLHIAHLQLAGLVLTLHIIQWLNATHHHRFQQPFHSERKTNKFLIRRGVDGGDGSDVAAEKLTALAAAAGHAFVCDSTSSKIFTMPRNVAGKPLSGFFLLGVICPTCDYEIQGTYHP